MPNIWYYINHPKKPANILCFKCGYCKIGLTKLMFILWPLCRYFTLNLMFMEVHLVQYCNMFQTCVFRKNFNKILMQFSHSRHANVIQVWGYNCNKTKIVRIDANIIFIKTSKNVQQMENINSMPLFTPKKPK
jgi:hypothetical protein